MARFFTSAQMLKYMSFVVVFGAWEIAGRIPVSPAFPDAIRRDPAYLDTVERIWSSLRTYVD
jgi:hypothetical protein